jgi:hypothetical protein
MDAFDEESRTILIEQEINKINMNMTTGKTCRNHKVIT